MALYDNYGNPLPFNGWNSNPLNNINFQSPLTKQKVQTVHGAEGARAYPLAPDSSVLLLDDTQKIVWCKITDVVGVITVVGYPYGDPISENEAPMQQTQAKSNDETPVYVTTKEFDELKEKVNKLLEELK